MLSEALSYLRHLASISMVISPRRMLSGSPMFNQKKGQKKMKKFWNLMLAALVIFGAVACTENQEDRIDANEQKAVLSFVANIANDTRTVLEQVDGQWTTNWTGADKLYVYVENGTRYEFTNSAEAPATFSCTAEGVDELRGQAVKIDNGADFDSTKGLNGGSLYGEGNNFPYEAVTLSADNAFFRLSSVFVGTLTASEPVFYYNGEYHNDVTLRPGEDVYVAFKPFNGTLNYSINGQVQKELTAAMNFTAKNIYPLGNVVTSELKVADFGVVGAHQGWNSANKDAMYLIPGSNTYVRYDVKLAAGGFKIYGETSKTVTIEHPEVTGGESGYLFLKPNSNWTQANARFAAYFFGNGTEWISMTDSNKDGIYAVQKPSKTYPNVIFCRMNPSASANNWDNKWNQTGDLKIPTDGNNLFSVPSGSWDGSTTGWSKHTPVEHQDAWTEVTEEIYTHWLGMSNNSSIKTDWMTGYSNNEGGDIKVSDVSKTYDIYFSREADQDWGFVYNFAVLESGSPAPKLK